MRKIILKVIKKHETSLICSPVQIVHPSFNKVMQANTPVREKLWRIATNQALNCVWKRRTPNEPSVGNGVTTCTQSNQSGAVAGGEWKQAISLTSVSVQSAGGMPSKHRISHPCGFFGGGGDRGMGGQQATPHAASAGVLLRLSANGCSARSSPQPPLDKTCLGIGSGYYTSPPAACAETNSSPASSNTAWTTPTRATLSPAPFLFG